MPNGERRKYKRIPADFFVDYRSPKFFLFIKGKNISQGGLFLETTKIEPPGTKVNLVLSFLGEEIPINAYGTVRWSRQKLVKINNQLILCPGMGIEFTKLQDYGKKVIQKIAS